MLFYFSKGIIQTLKAKKSLYLEAVGKSTSVASIIRFQELNIVQVLQINVTARDLVEILLHDTISSYNFFIDKETLAKHETNKKKVCAGSVIILKELSFVLGSWNSPSEYLITLADFTQIGWSDCSDILESHNKQNVVIPIHTSTQQPETCEDVLQTEIPTSQVFCSINKLNESFNNLDWSIKAELCKITALKEFNSKSTNNMRKYIRLLFGDESGYIEAVAFEETALQLEGLLIGKVYTIRKGDFKAPTQKGYRSWPEQKHLVQFDLNLRNDSVVKLVPNYKIWLERDIPKEIIPIKKRSLSETRNDSDEENDCQLKPKKQTRLELARIQDSKIMEREKITPISDLIALKFESFVNVIGLIENVGELSSLERPEKSSIALRKFKLIDQSKTVVSVTLWGKQATEFCLATGEVLLLRRVKMTNYGGLSLSIMRATEVNVLPEKYRDSEVIELRKWWKETWWKSRQKENYVSINSLLMKDKLKSFKF